MAKKLSDISIKELSLVFAEKDGTEWAPRNSEARILAVKGAEKGLVGKALDVLKAYFSVDQDELGQPQSYPVSEAVDNIDNDGDGPEDYNEIVRAICSLYGDIGQACAIGEDAARSAAIVACVDSFLAGLDKLRSGDTDKAGARHSADDIETLHAAYDAIDQIGKHQAALMGHLEKLGVTGATSSDNGEIGKDEDDGPNDSRENDKAAPVVTEEAPTEKSAELEMTQEEIAALIAAEVAKATAVNAEAVEAAKAEAKAEANEAAAKAKADADAAVAKAQADAAAAEARAHAADETLRMAAGLAAQPTGASATAHKGGLTRLQAVMKAQMALNPESHVI